MTDSNASNSFQSNVTESQSVAEQLMARLRDSFPEFFTLSVRSSPYGGDVVATADGTVLLTIAARLKDQGFSMVADLTAVDWLDQRECRFTVVYQFLNVEQRQRLQLSVDLAESKADIPSLITLYPGVNFMERECWDMFGIVFTGHGDLRRLLMYDEFKGHPLRKDYPVQLKQPRVPLRAPEVRNTAVDMKRSDLVKIGGRKV